MIVIDVIRRGVERGDRQAIDLVVDAFASQRLNQLSDSQVQVIVRLMRNTVPIMRDD